MAHRYPSVSPGGVALRLCPARVGHEARRRQEADAIYACIIERKLPAGSRNQATGRTAGVR